MVAFRLGRFPDSAQGRAGLVLLCRLLLNVKTCSGPGNGIAGLRRVSTSVLSVTADGSMVLRLCVGGLVAKVWFFQRRPA